MRVDGTIESDPHQLHRVLEWLVVKYNAEVRARQGLGSPVLMAFIEAVGQSVRIREVVSLTKVPDQRSERLWISVKDAAKGMGCSEQWVRELARGGRLPARRVGRTWLIDATRFQEDL